jgi:dTMP kinase
MSGKFITVEGVDGAGKSTFIPRLEKRLRSEGADVLVTREPGGTHLGELLRTILLEHAMSIDTEALLMFAARQQHLDEVIRPALRAGRWVLCDRFTDATFAYQGAGRGVPEQKLALLENWVQEGLQPDLTVLFDLPVELARLRSGGARDPDRFEAEQAGFFVRVREGYLRRAKMFPQRFRVVDCSRTRAEVEKQLDAIELFHG